MFPGLVGGDEGIDCEGWQLFHHPWTCQRSGDHSGEALAVSGDDRGELSRTALVGTLELRWRESSKLHPVVSVAVILPVVQPEGLGWVQSSLSKERVDTETHNLSQSKGLGL